MRRLSATSLRISRRSSSGAIPSKRTDVYDRLTVRIGMKLWITRYATARPSVHHSLMNGARWLAAVMVIGYATATAMLLWQVYGPLPVFLLIGISLIGAGAWMRWRR